MWRLGSIHCRKRGERGLQIQIIDGAALKGISCECFAAVRRNVDKFNPQSEETGHARQFHKAPQF
jgi:hypothetical protein